MRSKSTLNLPKKSAVRFNVLFTTQNMVHKSMFYLLTYILWQKMTVLIQFIINDYENSESKANDQNTESYEAQ